MATASVAESLAKRWWMLLIRGILAVLFGILACVLPGPALVALVLIFGVYAVADGLTAIWVGAASRVWALVIVGVLGVIAGILTFIYPGITAIALLYLIAAWAIVRGLFEIVAAIQFRKEIRGEWAFITAGILSTIFGVALVAKPAAGALAMVWVIGAFALLFGVVMIILAFQVRALPEQLKKLAKEV